MKRYLLTSILILMVLASPGWTATITSAGSGNASAGATWVGGSAPANDDVVVIADDHAVAWDIDSSGWAAGVAGLTVTGDTDGDGTPGMLYFPTTGTTNYLKIKTGTTLNGTTVNGVKGRVLANSDGVWATSTAYPQAATATIYLNTTAYINAANLDLKIICNEPTNREITLTGTEDVGQTVLEVDTDVTGDAAWVAGATVAVCDDERAQEYEFYTINAGGIAAGSITLSSALTVGKTAGGKVVLCTRNVRIIGSTGASTEMIENAVGGTVKAAITPGTAQNCYAFGNACSDVAIGGCLYNLSHGVDSGSGHTLTTCTLTGNGSGVYSGSGHTLTTCTLTGNGSGVNSGSGHTLTTCTLTGNGNGVNYGSGHTLTTCTLTGNANGVGYGSGHTLTTCTLTGNTRGVNSGSLYSFAGCTMSNTTDVSDVVMANLYNCSLSGTTEINGYNTKVIPEWGYVASYKHDQTAGAYKGCSRGAVVLSETTTYPTGYSQGFKMICESATMRGIFQTECTLAPGETLRVRGQMKFADDHTGYEPRLEIIDYFADPIVVASSVPLSTSNGQVTEDGTETDWQDVEVSYTNNETIPKRVFVRVTAKRATGDVYFALENGTTNEELLALLTTTASDAAAAKTAAEANKALLESATYGLAALRNLINLIPWNGRR